MVYFILDEGTHLVKIGRAASPLRRLRELQTGSAGALHLLAVVDHDEDGADVAAEARYHMRFARWKARGEWYHLSADLVLAMARGSEALTGPGGHWLADIVWFLSHVRPEEMERAQTAVESW